MKALIALALLAASGPTHAKAPVRARAVELVKKFSAPADQPLTQTGVSVSDGGWRIQPTGPGAVRLFEVPGARCEACRLLFRAKVKVQDLAAPAFLEMWVRVPEKGQFFSRGLDQTMVGSVDWTSIEIPFFFQEGQRADLVKLNVFFQGSAGTLWIKDVELWSAPLP